MKVKDVEIKCEEMQRKNARLLPMALKQPVRLINLPLIQHVELAGKENADEERQKRGIDKKGGGCQLL